MYIPAFMRCCACSVAERQGRSSSECNTCEKWTSEAGDPPTDIIMHTTVYYSTQTNKLTSDADALEMKAGRSCRNSATNVTGAQAKIFSERKSL